MNEKSKGKEFFDKLSDVERQTIMDIMRLENTSERLLKVRSTSTENKIKEIIEKRSMEWEDNDI